MRLLSASLELKLQQLAAQHCVDTDGIEIMVGIKSHSPPHNFTVRASRVNNVPTPSSPSPFSQGWEKGKPVRYYFATPLCSSSYRLEEYLEGYKIV